METPRILIVGAGGLGTSLGGYLNAKGNKVIFWDVDPAKATDERPLHEIVPFTDFILLCIPSWAVRSVLSETVSAMRPDTIIVSFSKGIDVAGNKTTGELLPELLPAVQPFVIVGGPMLAAEIAAGKNAIAVFASPFAAAAKKVADLFRSPVFATEISRDAVSVSLAGVLKNIYAIGLGIADGLELDGNEKGWIAARAVNEMLVMAEKLDADRKIILGTAGLADFIATAYSPYSRNREIGDEIVKKRKCNLKGEGIASLPPLMARLGPCAAQFSLLNAIKNITIDCKSPKATMEALFVADSAAKILFRKI
ncbi:MAG: 2-dehydropantoate 2-reductase N-terminal domain-containing protein [Minisyncoccia bacterium]|jgi:glycerol-3-phosphate dehydrogenase (NAD(P)+)